MRIKSIQQTRNPEKLDLMFDDGSKLRVMATVVPDLGLYASMEVDAALLERILQTHEKAQTRLRAVRIVAAANVSQRELQRRLIQKGQKPEDAAEAAQCLEALGAQLTQETAGLLITPIGARPANAKLDVGESGSTLRFLLPVLGALGVQAEIQMQGRLPERPLSPLWEVL